jgi:LmbE family N-acetylglucosaminyl deacetylase
MSPDDRAKPDPTPPVADATPLVAWQQEYMRAFIWRKVVDKPAATRALLIAAHPDDVEFGCGGTVLKLLDAQVKVRQVVLTDGRLAAEKPEERDAMAATRAEEAKSVAAHLMLPPPDLLACPEGELAQPQRQADLVARLVAILRDFEPDAIFLPYFLDQHPDHRLANHLLSRALPESGLELASITVHAYEAWGFVPPVLVVDVSDVMAEKIKLVSLYRSQTKLLAYLELTDLLARRRASLAGPNAKFVEVLQPFPAAEWVARVTALDLANPASLRLRVDATPLP